MPVIAMTQEMATLGKDVALGVAEKLGLQLVRHEVGDMVAGRMQVKKSLIRRIRELLYEEGFTISGARNRLDNGGSQEERPEPAARGGRPEGAVSGVDIGAIKRELRAVLDQLQG